MTIEGSTRNQELPHSPNEVIIGITHSPKGEPCVGMTLNGENWILVTTRTGILSDKLRETLEQEFDTKSLLGLPIDSERSIEENKIVLFENPPTKTGVLVGLVGIYVPAERFDALISMISF